VPTVPVTSVPLATKSAPSAMKARAGRGDEGSMNCGTKARKNSATLGLSTDTSTASRKIAVDGRGAAACRTEAASASDAPAGRASRATSIRIPSQTSHAAPRSLSAVNAAAEVASSADTPSAPSVTWTSPPAPIPSAAIQPALVPCSPACVDV
jgi:hypothetical protein